MTTFLDLVKPHNGDEKTGIPVIFPEDLIALAKEKIEKSNKRADEHHEIAKVTKDYSERFKNQILAMTNEIIREFLIWHVPVEELKKKQVEEDEKEV